MRVITIQNSHQNVHIREFSLFLMLLFVFLIVSFFLCVTTNLIG